MTDRILVDTSAWIHALRRSGDPEVRSAVKAAMTEARAVFCDMVLLELWNGAQGSREKRLLRELERDLEKVSSPPAVWEIAVGLARLCREGGLSVPASDLFIAACAQHHDLRLLHCDDHFDRIARVQQNQPDHRS